MWLTEGRRLLKRDIVGKTARVVSLGEPACQQATLFAGRT